jgi:putative ABC transport system substrate-binding protein
LLRWSRAAQSHGRSRRLPRSQRRSHGSGFLGLTPAAASTSRVEALQTGLRELGWIEGKNILIEFRWAPRVDQLPDLAAELVQMKVDIIFAPSSTFVEAARKATQTIPIVFALHADPVGLGHVASLARPGGNITGLTMQATELNTKQLEILKEALPQSTRFGVLWNPTLLQGSVFGGRGVTGIGGRPGS